MSLPILLSLVASDTCLPTGKDYQQFFETKSLQILLKNAEFFKIKSYSDTTAVYGIYEENGFSVELKKSYSNLDNDIFIINGKSNGFFKCLDKPNKSLIINEDIGNVNLQSVVYYLVGTKTQRSYFILEGSVDGAAGSMSSLKLFYVVVYTDKNHPKSFHFQNWASWEFSFSDFNDDGYLDFSCFKDLDTVKQMEITHYSLKDLTLLMVKKRSRWRAEWKENCLSIFE